MFNGVQSAKSSVMNKDIVRDFRSVLAFRESQPAVVGDSPTCAATRNNMAAKASSDQPALPRIKLCHLQLLPILSGVQRVSLEEFRRLDPVRYEIHLACSEPGPLADEAERLGVQCHFFPSLKRPISPRSDVMALREITEWMKREKFDIVHTHSSKTGILGRLAAHQANVPVIAHTVHGFAFRATGNYVARWLFRRAERLCGSFTDALICLNQSDVRTAVDTLGIAPQRVEQIANGVDPVTFAPCEDETLRDHLKLQRLNIGSGHSVVMMIGRMWIQKNPLAFVQAASEAIGRGSKAVFVMIGDGGMRADTERRIAELGIESSFRLLGWRDDVAQVLPLADLLVLPSRWEGMPLVLLEAQACGLPVIASDIPGNQHCVLDGIDGILVRLDQPGGFGRAISELLDDPDRRQRMGRAGRRKVLEQFGIDRRTQRVVEVYERLLEQKIGVPLASAQPTLVCKTS